MDKMLRTKYGLKTDELSEGWRKLHNEELHNYCDYQRKG
jgi:hypothetical protein